MKSRNGLFLTKRYISTQRLAYARTINTPMKTTEVLVFLAQLESKRMYKVQEWRKDVDICEYMLKDVGADREASPRAVLTKKAIVTVMSGTK